MQYFVISDNLYAKLDGLQDGPNRFAWRYDNLGRRVCATTAIGEFGAQFVGHRPLVVELSPEDFPPLPAPEGLPGYTPDTQ